MSNEIQTILDTVAIFIQSVPVTDPTWNEKRNQAIESFKDLLEILVNQKLLYPTVRPCPMGVIYFPK